MKYEKSCGAIVYRFKDNSLQFLLICHVNGKHWAFPKGHVENDETEIETALREIKEETGLDVEIETEFRETVSYNVNKNVIKEVVYFIARTKLDSDKLNFQKEELLDAKWLDYKTAYEMITFDNNRKIIEKAKAYIKGECQNR